MKNKWRPESSFNVSEEPFRSVSVKITKEEKKNANQICINAGASVMLLKQKILQENVILTSQVRINIERARRSDQRANSSF